MLIDGPSLNEDVVNRATTALFRYINKSKEESSSSSNSNNKLKLFDSKREAILIVIQLKTNKASKQKPRFQPIRVSIPHSIFSEQDDSVCIFCRSEDKASLISFASSCPTAYEAISVDDLRKKYNQFQDRKKLLNQFSHFFCDERVIRHVYNLLGRVFNYRASKMPISIRLPEKLVRAEQVSSVLQKGLQGCTYMHLPASNHIPGDDQGCRSENMSVRVGSSGMTAACVSANILQGVPQAVAALSGGWGAVQSLHLKAPSSAALPLYCCDPSLPLPLTGLDPAKRPAEGEGPAGKAKKQRKEEEGPQGGRKRKQEEAVPTESHGTEAASPVPTAGKKKGRKGKPVTEQVPEKVEQVPEVEGVPEKVQEVPVIAGKAQKKTKEVPKTKTAKAPEAEEQIPKVKEVPEVEGVPEKIQEVPVKVQKKAKAVPKKPEVPEVPKEVPVIAGKGQKKVKEVSKEVPEVVEPVPEVEEVPKKTPEVPKVAAPKTPKADGKAKASAVVPKGPEALLDLEAAEAALSLLESAKKRKASVASPGPGAITPQRVTRSRSNSQVSDDNPPLLVIGVEVDKSDPGKTPRAQRGKKAPGLAAISEVDEAAHLSPPKQGLGLGQPLTATKGRRTRSNSNLTQD